MGDTVKANDKLPRGSFYYVQVGHRFYAGESLDIIEREIITRPERGIYSPYWHSRRHNSRLIKDKRNNNLATYLEPKKATKTIKRELTGTKQPKLVDDVREAKQFRKKNQAQSACERIESVYGALDTKVTIKLYEGEKK